MIGQPQWAPAVAAGRDLAALARQIGVAPASLAMAFALLDPLVTTVLFGATRPEQIRANLGALALAERLTPGERDRLAAIGVGSGP
jgi:aryl-alcohol dehydrogenase-like predicted oxidoreductase